jgi:hypothetical protein
VAVQVLLKDFASHAEALTRQLRDASEELAERTAWPIRYQASGATNKERIAREIARVDGIEQGLICILTAVEPCLRMRSCATRKPNAGNWSHVTASACFSTITRSTRCSASCTPASRPGGTLGCGGQRPAVEPGASRHPKSAAGHAAHPRAHPTQKAAALTLPMLRQLLAICDQTARRRRDGVLLRLRRRSPLLGAGRPARRRRRHRRRRAPAAHSPRQDRQAGQGAEVGLPRWRHAETSPVPAFEPWQVVARRNVGPLFRRISTGDGIGDTALHLLAGLELAKQGEVVLGQGVISNLSTLHRLRPLPDRHCLSRRDDPSCCEAGCARCPRRHRRGR